ncbi:MAG: HAD family hydrolase, partial [Atribacterota bacterium]|nr:HAD family hydrolase [Atribacterota bacterium]
MQKKKEHIINSIGTIIFDLDDTLIKTSDLYHQARKKLFSLISEMGFPMEDVVNKLDEIDIQHIKEKGFSKERYPLSLIKTYHYFCNLREINPRAEIEKKIIKIAGEVFEITPQLVDGSEKVLSYLKGKYKLILATLGDREVQQKKIENSGLENYFSAIYIMHFKNTEEYRGIIKD